MEKFKSGFVSMIGRTNVGKSTLLNALVGEKVAIMVNKPQTTRTAIKAIVNRNHSQIIFIDTPGIHKPRTKLGEVMIETAFGTITDVDVILFLIEATSIEIGKGDQIILDKLKQTNKKVILVINKIDLVPKENLLALIKTYSQEYSFASVVPLSAIKTDGTEILLKEIEKLLPEGPAYYEEDEYTDQTWRQLTEEIIREKLLNLLDQEVPHGIYVEVEKMEETETKMGEPIYQIESTIYCLRKSHKGIIIGKNGAMLKRIGTWSRKELEKMLDCKVNLKLWVKVKEDWQDSSTIVKKFKNN